MKTILSLAVLFLICNFTYGKSLEKSFPFKKTSCSVGKFKSTLLLQFDKKLTDEENDFSGAPLVFLKSKKTHIIEPLTKPYPGDFSFASAKEISNCTDTQAFDLNDSMVAILYSKDNRPYQELIQMIIWDAKSDKIIQKQVLGAVVEYFKIKNGFAFSKMIPRSDVDQLEMTSTTGRKMSATDKDLNPLQTVTIIQNKLKIEYDPNLSYEKSNWKKYFKNQDDFLKSTGWNANNKSFQKVVVYEATFFDSKESNILESCIVLTDKRGGKFEPTDWRCLKENQ